MKTLFVVVLVSAAGVLPLDAQLFCDNGVKAAELAAVTDAWDSLKSKSCPPSVSKRFSEERVDEILGLVLSEEISLSEVQELLEITRIYRCSLSDQARAALDAVMTEAEIRRFDLAEFVRGEVDLVVRHTMPQAWEALVVESGHIHTSVQPEKAAPIIVIGCVVAFAGGVGMITACLNDVAVEYARCDSGGYCSGPVNWSCCAALQTNDQINCYASVGQKGARWRLPYLLPLSLFSKAVQ